MAHFFPIDLWPARLGNKCKEINLVHILLQTRLLRGIYAWKKNSYSAANLESAEYEDKQKKNKKTNAIETVKDYYTNFKYRAYHQ